VETEDEKVRCSRCREHVVGRHHRRENGLQGIALGDEGLGLAYAEFQQELANLERNPGRAYGDVPGRRELAATSGNLKECKCERRLGVAIVLPSRVLRS
jgi:hypothetical protein